jgi:hypothetical protein
LSYPRLKPGVIDARPELRDLGTYEGAEHRNICREINLSDRKGAEHRNIFLLNQIPEWFGVIRVWSVE